MIKITHKLIAKEINRTEGYARILLHRRGINLKPDNLLKVLELIKEYKVKDETG